MAIEEKIAILECHKENLNHAKTFENYKIAHLAYIDFLIDDFKNLKNLKAQKDNVEKFLNFKETY